jgi:Alr-MurF fusion protein
MLLQDIANITHGNIINKANYHVDTLVIDSRKVAFAQSALFICIVTDKDDGHRYIADAYQKGVRSFLISDTVAATQFPEASFVQVGNTLRALQQLVAANRNKYSYPVVGITGSNGKTIVKEWLYHITDGHFHVVRNPKSYNSQVGVALSVWDMQPDHSLGIFEAGISEPQEMHHLANMIRPSIGIFTNIGDAHSENFSTSEEKIQEKLKLFYHCETLIYNADNSLLANEIKKAQKSKLIHCDLLTWGTHKSATLLIKKIDSTAERTSITAKYKNKNLSIIIPFSDSASIENAMHIWLASLALGLSNSEIASRMLTLTPVAMRLELKKAINGSLLINDSYNSDIGALHIALDFLLQQKQNNNYTLILSDILQSKKSNMSLYYEVAELIAEKGITKFIGIGEAISSVRQVFDKLSNITCFFYPTTHQFLEHINLHQFSNENILLKGARVFQFEQISLALEEKIHQTVLEVNLNALAENYATYERLVKKDVAIMAMVKAFSYGNGGFEIASKLQFLGADYLGVAYADEGVMLRNNGINIPIMVMNPDSGAYDAMITYKLEPEIYNMATLRKFVDACVENDVSQFPIHLKIDTGMHRLGFLYTELQEAIDFILQHPQVKLQSVFSHLAASDDPELDKYTQNQAKIFDKSIALINKHINYDYYKHVCNTSGIVRHKHLHYNMVRLGVGLYGVDYSGLLGKKIKHVGRLKTSIAQIKTLDKGETVGYNRKGKLARPSRVATVCIGYADGVSRALSNGKGKMWLHGKLAPIIGNVCMDMCMLDVTDIAKAKEGDEVIVFGPELPIVDFANMSNTIAYEVMTDISTRVKRVFYEE